MSIKRMDIREFRELGYLQEANRRFFHPLGLALEIIVPGIGEEDQTWKLGGVWDRRDDPEGIYFGQESGRPGFGDPEKARSNADYIGGEITKRAAARASLFGSASWLQPVPGTTPPESDPGLAVLWSS